MGFGVLVNCRVPAWRNSSQAKLRPGKVRAGVLAQGTRVDIPALMEHTDTVAEIQNTLRMGTDIRVSGVEIVPS